MSYQTGEAQILTLCQAIVPTTWTAKNSVSLANDSTNAGQTLLNKGDSHHFLMLTPGPFQSPFLDIGMNSRLITWTTTIRLLVLKDTKRGPLKTLAEDRQAILDQIAKYRLLNGLAGVMHAQISQGGPIMTEKIGDARRKVVYFKQEMTLQWDEETSISQQD